MAKPTPKRKKKRSIEVPQEGRVYVTTSFNNTLITVTDLLGNVICSGSPGTCGFRGTRKSTSYAAATAAIEVAKQAHALGMRRVSVYVKGPGPGRNTAVKSLRTGGLRVTSITDITPIPHNGCRARKRRRV